MLQRKHTPIYKCINVTWRTTHTVVYEMYFNRKVKIHEYSVSHMPRVYVELHGYVVPRAVRFLFVRPSLSVFNAGVLYLLTYICLIYFINSDWSHKLLACLLSHEFNIYGRTEYFQVILEMHMVIG